MIDRWLTVGPPWSAVLLLSLSVLSATAQTNPHFNLRLVLNYQSAEKAIGLYEGLVGRGSDIAPLRGSQIALATTALLAQRHLTTDDLEQSLDAVKFGQISTDDVFKLNDGKRAVAQIKELLNEIRRRNFGQRVVSTVEPLFPTDARISTAIPVYFVAFGHQNIDAYVRRVVWQGDTPRFVGEGEGELTIVMNLTKAVGYGRKVEERFVWLLSTVAHEVFHAAFGVYKDTSPTWSAYRAERTSYFDELLDLTQNEGIAHYLSFEQRTGGYLPDDWEQRVSTAVDQFNKSATELLSPRISRSRAGELIRASNTSGFWESYGAITGLFIAREIDRGMGREALTRTVAEGPAKFFGTYVALSERDRNLPRLSEPLLASLRLSR